jgi:hypothetical protein
MKTTVGEVWLPQISETGIWTVMAEKMSLEISCDTRFKVTSTTKEI